jgi:hypothetical protein
VLLSQTALAEKLSAELGVDFDDSKLSRIEKGKQDASSREIHALAVILGQSVAWLQGIDDDGFESRAKGVSLRSISHSLTQPVPVAA